MHGAISEDNESGGKDGKANDIVPKGENIEAKGTEDGCAWDFDVETIPVRETSVSVGSPPKTLSVFQSGLGSKEDSLVEKGRG